MEHDMSREASFAKDDKGKLPITLVPMEIIRCCAAIRKYGVEKYHTPNSWVIAEKQRYVDAMMRHLLSYLEGDLVDEESGLPHLWHAACNMAFICEMEKPDWDQIRKRLIEKDPMLQQQIKFYMTTIKNQESDNTDTTNESTGGEFK